MTPLASPVEDQISATPEKKAPIVTSNKIETVTRHLEERIAGGEWAVHESLPPQSQLAREYGVSLGTIAIGLRNLHKKGCIDLVPYKGATVTRSKEEGSKHRRFPLIALRGSYVKHAQVHRTLGTNVSVIGGVVEAADAEHCPLLLFPNSREGEIYDLSHYRNRDVEGVIFLGGGCYQEALALRKEGFPVLLANRPITATPLNYIDYNHSETLEKAVNLFHENGHRRIAVLSPPTTTPGNFNSLLPEFLTLLAAQRNFYDTTDYWLAFDRSQAENYEPYIQKLFSLEEPPTAIFCINPGLTVLVMTIARQRGLRIPEDLSLIGSCFHSVTEIPVTGFVLPHEELGKYLLHEMYAIIENPFHCIQERLSPIFVDRHTVGPVKPSRSK